MNQTQDVAAAFGDKFDTVKVREDLPFLNAGEGEYKVTCDGLRAGVNQSGQQYFAVDMTIDEAVNGSPFKAGDRVTDYFLNRNPKYDFYIKETKSAAAVILGMRVNDIDAAVMKNAVETNKGEGSKFRVTCAPKEGGKSKKTDGKAWLNTTYSAL